MPFLNKETIPLIIAKKNKQVVARRRLKKMSAALLHLQHINKGKFMIPVKRIAQKVKNALRVISFFKSSLQNIMISIFKINIWIIL